jgi:hypothetical protein
MLVMLENFLEKALQSVPNSHPPKETVLSWRLILLSTSFKNVVWK